MNRLFGEKFQHVESRSLCVGTSNCKLGSVKLGNAAVFVNCTPTKRSGFRVPKFSLAGKALMSQLRALLGEPLQNFLTIGVEQGNFKQCCVGSNALALRSGMSVRNV